MAGEQVGNINVGPEPFFEVINVEQLARRWQVPASWIREQTRNRASDRIPHVRLGRYVRFCWGSPALDKWFVRRQVGVKREP